MKITVDSFGKLSTGETAALYTLENNHGLSVSITNYGGAIIRLLVPDRKGQQADVVLAHADAGEYETNPGSFGATIGRNANRIRDAVIEIDDLSYTLEKNDGKNNLHTGKKGLQYRLWDAEAATTEETAQLRLFTTVGDLEDGFPGILEVEVTFTLTNDNALVIEYHGVSEQDTIINLTNHSYFNLAGHDSGSIDEHLLWMNAAFYSPNDAESIPTGEILSVKDTPMDFTTQVPLGPALASDHEQVVLHKGIDNNFLLSGNGYRRVARLTHPPSGRVMHVSTDLPAMHLYTGNFLPNPEGTKQKEDATYAQHGGVCFETQTVPNAAPMSWLSSPIYPAGTEYISTTTFRFELAESDE